MEEVMANAAVIGDEQITDASGKKAPESKPGNEGYTAQVPDNNDKLDRKDKPYLKVDLTSDESKEAKQVSKIGLQGNLGRVSVEATKEGDDSKPELLLKDVPVPQDGLVSLPQSSDKLEQVKVIFESPKEKDAKDYKVVLSVFACGHFPGTSMITVIIQDSRSSSSLQVSTV